MNNFPIKIKLLIIVLSTIISISTIIAYQAIYSINKLSNDNISNYRADAYKQKKR